MPAFVDAYEAIVAPLVKAAPPHLARRRKAFASAAAIDDLIEQRAELLIAALTLDSGLLDSFGEPHPDLICCGGALGIEVGTRWKDDVRRLHDRVEERLSEEGRDVSVHLVFSGKPLALGEEMLGRIVEEVSRAAASFDDRESLHFVPPKLRVDLFPRAPGDGLTVVWDTGFELGDHMVEAQREIANLLHRKEHQAETMETILLLDISRVGQSARRLSFGARFGIRQSSAASGGSRWWSA
jgi:hypothetical protein